MRRHHCILPLAPGVLAALKEDIVSEFPRPRTISPDQISDLHAELIHAFLCGVDTPIYRVGINWKKLEFGNTHISFLYSPSFGLSTADGDALTRLVLVCCDHSLRLDLRPVNRDTFRVTLSKWERWGGSPSKWNNTTLTLSQARRAYDQGEYVPQDGLNAPTPFEGLL